MSREGRLARFRSRLSSTVPGTSNLPTCRESLRERESWIAVTARTNPTRSTLSSLGQTSRGPRIHTRPILQRDGAIIVSSTFWSFPRQSRSVEARKRTIICCLLTSSTGRILPGADRLGEFPARVYIEFSARSLSPKREMKVKIAQSGSRSLATSPNRARHRFPI